MHVQALRKVRSNLAASSGVACPAITAGSGQVREGKAGRKPLTKKGR